MKKMNLALVLALSLSAFSSSAFETFQVTNGLLNVSIISLQGSQFSSAGGVPFEMIEDDAVSFLANNEKSDVLAGFLSDLRMANPKLEQFSDKEILQALLASE